MDRNFNASRNDPLLFTDEELQYWLSSLPPTPQNDDVGIFAAPPTIVEEGQTTLLKSKSSDHIRQDVPCQQNTNATAAAATFVKGNSSSNKRKQRKSQAVDAERQRRKDMSTLHRSLRSLLPAEYLRGKRSMSDHLQETVKYIGDLEGNIKKLQEKRNELLKIKQAGSSSTTGQHNSKQQYVTVKACREGFIEVIVSTCASYDDEDGHQRFPLSKVLQLLSSEGLNVINCVSSRADSTFFHTIQALSNDGREIDLSLLQQNLTDQLR